MRIFYFLFVFLCAFKNSYAQHVAISIVAQHPSLERIRSGIEDTIHSYNLDIKITVANANGNPMTARQIADKLVSQKPDVFVGIGTLSAQTLHSVNNGQRPLVFGGVTDPYEAELLPRDSKSILPVTGSIDFPPTEAQLDAIHQHFPTVRKIGVLYNPGEINAVKQVESFLALAQKRGYEVIKAPVVKICDLPESAKKLANSTDLIYIPNDNTVVSGVEAVVQAAQEYNIPVLSSDPESVSRGATLAVAHDQYDIGVKTGELVVRILKGDKAQEIEPVKTAKILSLFSSRMSLGVSEH